MDETNGRTLVFILGYEQMARLTLIILSTYFFASDLFAGGLVRYSKKLPTLGPSGYRLLSTKMFIDGDRNTFLMIDRGIKGKIHAGYVCAYMNDDPINIEGYGKICDGFLKEGHFHLACRKDETISIYKVRNGMELVGSCSLGTKRSLGKRIQFTNIYKVIPVTGHGNSYYLLTSGKCFPVNPVEFLVNFFSGGHGIGYAKPFLIEMQGDKPAKSRKLRFRYGGKIDESYYIKKVVQHENVVHLLGFRMQEERDWGPEKMESKPEILHHAAYNLEKKKIVKTHTICTKIPWAEKDKNILSYYGPLSMDALSNKIFVVFSWIEERIEPRPIPIKDINSTIFYWQYCDGVAGDVEEIADGFVPLVKVDSSGNVHVLWVDKNASLVHKVKRNGKWGNDTVIVKNLDVDQSIVVRGAVTAEFDDDNLHIVYPSDGTLVHSVLKVN